MKILNLKMYADRSFLNNYQGVFQRDGFYGGNQNAPKKNPQKYAGIIRRYYPEYNDEQIKNLMEKLSSEGCGYVALVNMIFLHYIGKESLYKETFGLFMYTPSGELNFNDVLVDFYCDMDNRNPFLWFSYLDHTEDKSEVLGYGTTKDNSKWRFEQYMKKHGLKVKVNPIHVTLKNYEKKSKYGPIMVSVNPTTLYDKYGTVASDSKGGHTMTVIGTTENGLIRVSSWGKEYFIKPGSYSGYEYYQQVLFL